MHPTCIISTFQAGLGHDLGHLIRMDKRLRITAYVSIVADQVLPVLLMAHLNGGGYFQPANAPCHGVRIVQEWVQEHEEVFTWLKWHPESPDLNPIEHLWVEVRRASTLQLKFRP